MCAHDHRKLFLRSYFFEESFISKSCQSELVELALSRISSLKPCTAGPSRWGHRRLYGTLDDLRLQLSTVSPTVSLRLHSIAPSGLGLPTNHRHRHASSPLDAALVADISWASQTGSRDFRCSIPHLSFCACTLLDLKASAQAFHRVTISQLSY